ncbi:MAG: hypothetical protein QXU81_08325 [Candidatus Bathyarchaeia archaeon]
MRAVVTGGCGFIGSNLVECLVKTCQYIGLVEQTLKHKVKYFFIVYLIKLLGETELWMEEKFVYITLPINLSQTFLLFYNLSAFLI